MAHDNLAPAGAAGRSARLRDLLKEMRETAEGWESRNYRNGHYDDFGAGQTERAQIIAGRLLEWLDQIDELLPAAPEGGIRPQEDDEVTRDERTG